MNELIGPLAQGIGSFASSLFSQSAQKEENQRNRDFALEMWNRQNEYNSPSNQRKLLEAGGYNPYALSDAGVAGQSQTPLSPSSSPLPQFHNPTDGIASLLQNGLQIQSNMELQKAKQLESITDTMLKVYKDLGQNGLNKFSAQLAPILEGLNFEGSPYMTMFNEELRKLRSERYNIDMDSLLKDFQYESNKKWTDQERKAHFDNLLESTKYVVEQIKLASTEGRLNEKRMWQLASEYARNMAQAYEASKVGDYYHVYAGQMNIVNKMLDLQYQDQEADFAMNTSVRKFKKQIPNRQVALDLFTQGLGAQGVQLGIANNSFGQNFDFFTKALGNLVKVNFGVSSNRTNFNNLNPQKGNSTMFYSGDGYFLNNGVLQKGNW